MPKNHKGEASVRRLTLGLRLMALVSLAATLIFASSRLAGAKTINANSASQSDVTAAIISATDNDTVIVPGGTATWTHTLSVKKAIELRGAGVGGTIIKDNVQNGSLIGITLVANKVTRLTGIEFQGGGRTSYYTGVVTVTGSNTNGSRFRMDHCKWGEDVNGSPLFDTVIGVIDHNTFIRRTGEDGHAFWVFGTRWNGSNYGDGSWSSPTNFGSSQFLFFEDNTFTSNNPGYLISLCDAYDGARFVLRHNTITGFTFQNHGTESSGRRRGTRATEFYNNYCDGKNINQFVGGSRSGSQVIHDNTCVNFWSGGTWHLNNYRSYAAFPVFGGADGTNPWDVNDPRVYFTGTAAQNSSGTTVTVSGNPNWATNRWVGYVVRRTTNLCNVTNANTFGLITSNTSNTLTWIPNAFTGLAALSICAGDSVEIRRVIQAMDMSGRARGGLLANLFNPPRPPSWNDQVTERVYAWNNGSMHVNTTISTIHEGEHFINAPMPGYTPYVYPHPLVTGGELSLLELPVLPSPAATRSSLRRPWGGKKQPKTKELKRKPGKKDKQNPADEMAESQEKLGN
jgi:hypothetical protein